MVQPVHAMKVGSQTLPVDESDRFWTFFDMKTKATVAGTVTNVLSPKETWLGFIYWVFVIFGNFGQGFQVVISLKTAFDTS